MRDLRQYARGTNRRLIAGFVLLTLSVGGAAIYLVYGPRAMLLGLLCILAGLLPALLIWAALALLGRLADRADRAR